MIFQVLFRYLTGECVPSSWYSQFISLCLFCYKITCNTVRRRQRKQRAIARHKWYLFKQGLLQLTSADLALLYQKLAAHHSRDWKFLKQIHQAMTDSDESFPWRCASCARLNKKNMEFCPSCKAHWTTGYKHDATPKAPKYSEDAQWEDWTNWESYQWDNRKSSPRHRTGQSPRYRKGQPSPRARKGHKGKPPGGKGKKDGGDGGQELPQFLGKGSAPWPAVETPVSFGSATSSPFAPANPPSTPASTTSVVQETLQTLRHAYPEGNAPPEIQTLIEKYEQESAKSVTKAIHTATNSLSRAQRQLNETLEARKKH